MSWHAGGTEIVDSIREMRPGDWDASEGEVVDRILIMRPATRTRLCCGRDLEFVVEAERGTLTWGLWRCSRCERAYSVGPKLPPTWVGALARACIELYCDFCAEVEAAYSSEGADAAEQRHESRDGLSLASACCVSGITVLHSVGFSSVTNLEGVYK